MTTQVIFSKIQQNWKSSSNLFHQKSISSFLVFCLFTSFCCAQSTASISSLDKKTAPATTSAKKSEKAIDYSDEHSRFASMQLRNYLTKNTAYPKTMKENCIEGMVVVKVFISSKGKIKKSEIVKSPHAVFSQSVLETMSKVNAIGIHQRVYQGKPIVYVPIKFSL